jgi:DNA-directed RNA polymerase specialized sigma24 family protein
VTDLLLAWSDGDRAALDRLVPLIHAELYRLAKLYMRRQGPDHVLEPTALVNEAFVRLMGWEEARFQKTARTSSAFPHS